MSSAPVGRSPFVVTSSLKKTGMLSEIRETSEELLEEMDSLGIDNSKVKFVKRCLKNIRMMAGSQLG